MSDKELNSHDLAREIEISKLQEENEELKSLLRGTTHCFDEEEHRQLKEQQQAFIKYLEDEHTKIQTDIENEIDNNIKYFKIERRQTITKILQKYKEIIGVQDGQ